MFCRVVMCAKPREYCSETSASASGCRSVSTPCGIFTRSIWASSAWRWPYVPRTSRKARHWSGPISPLSNFASVSANSSMSDLSAKKGASAAQGGGVVHR